VERVPIKDKLNLTIEEAAEYSNIGINRIENMLKAPGCPFVLYVGRKKIVKRREFEKYLSKTLEV
jgi:excisionase family DNA binding protein